MFEITQLSMIMEMTNELAVGRWYESPRTGTSASPGQGLDGGNSDIASGVEHMGTFFLDPSGTQRAARYYHQTMHGSYGSHGKFFCFYFLNTKAIIYKKCMNNEYFTKIPTAVVYQML